MFIVTISATITPATMIPANHRTSLMVMVPMPMGVPRAAIISYIMTAPIP